MNSKPAAWLLADLGVTKTHSRPHVSDDNPYSESQFKTMEYRPEFPARFRGFEDARNLCGEFFRWYNPEHQHSVLGYVTPVPVHGGQAEERRAQRALVLTRAFVKHPECFVRGLPQRPVVPAQVWMNKPKDTPGGDPTEALEAGISPVRGFGPENGFHHCPVSNEQEPGRDLPRVKNQVSDDLVQSSLNGECLISLTGSGRIALAPLA